MASSAFERLAASYKQYEVYAQQEKEAVLAQQALLRGHQQEKQDLDKAWAERDEERKRLSKGPVIDESFQSRYVHIKHEQAHIKDELSTENKERQAMEIEAAQARVDACKSIALDFNAKKVAPLRLPVLKVLEDARLRMAKGAHVWLIESDSKDEHHVTRMTQAEVVHASLDNQKPHCGDFQTKSNELIHWTGQMNGCLTPRTFVR